MCAYIMGGSMMRTPDTRQRGRWEVGISNQSRLFVGRLPSAGEPDRTRRE